MPVHARSAVIVFNAEVLMRAWWLIPVVFAAGACHSDSTSPARAGYPTCYRLVGTSLNGANRPVWDDNAFAADPNGFQNYRVFSTTYTFASNDYLNGQCGSTWKLEGSTVAPEFVVGALSNGVAQCFAVSAIGVDQQESARSARATTLPDRRPQRGGVRPAGTGCPERVPLLAGSERRRAGAGQRARAGDLGKQPRCGLLGRAVPNRADSLLLQPRRTDVLLALYDSLPLADLTALTCSGSNGLPDPDSRLLAARR